jgi:aconitate hydratase
VVLRMGDDVSTDEILPAGARVLPFRSNIPRIAEFCFEGIDDGYPQRAREAEGGHAIAAGRNYGQGSSREHAALAPRTLGLRVVLAVSFARIHWQNLINFGVLPLRFADPADAAAVERNDVLELRGLHEAVSRGREVEVRLASRGRAIRTRHELSERQREMLLAGGLIRWKRDQAGAASES